jgi:hypothetical protein
VPTGGQWAAERRGETTTTTSLLHVPPVAEEHATDRDRWDDERRVMDAYSAPPVKPADYDGSQPLDPAYFGEVEEFVHYNLSRDNPVRGGGRAAAARALVEARRTQRLIEEQRAAGGTRPGSDAYEREQIAVEEARLEVKKASNRLSMHEYGLGPEVCEDQRRLADGYSALSEVRDMGGGEFTLVKGARREAAGMISDAAEIFPDEWVQASNECERPLQVRISKGARGGYNHSEIVETGFVPVPEFDHSEAEKSPRERLSTDPAYGDWREATNPYTGERMYQRTQYEVADASTRRKKDGTPAGADWEEWRHPDDPDTVHHRRVQRTDIKGSERRAVITLPSPGHHTEVSRMDGRDYGTGTAMHELTHRMERSVPMLRNAENAYLATRADVSKTVPIPGYDSHEVHYPGAGFATPYIAKAYPAERDGYPSSEVMAVGIESLFSGHLGGLVGTGKNRVDHDHRGFVLGTMAVLGRPR